VFPADAPTIVGDWGSSRLRLWLVQGGGVRAQTEARGLLAAADAPSEALRSAIAALPDAGTAGRIVLCGMAGARGGLAEAPYLPCPARFADWLDLTTKLAFDGMACALLPGLSCRSGTGQPDVMRGEETQIFGALHLRPDLALGAQTFLLPGTHSKWTRVEHGRITGFVTCCTGELYARLIGSSLVDPDAACGSEAFADGYEVATSRVLAGADLLPSLFEARAARLLDGREEGWSAGFLSGLLIGTEIASMVPHAIATRPLMLIGEGTMTAIYSRTLDRFGIEHVIGDGARCVLKGLELACADA